MLCILYFVIFTFMTIITVSLSFLSWLSLLNIHVDVINSSCRSNIIIITTILHTLIHSRLHWYYWNLTIKQIRSSLHPYHKKRSQGTAYQAELWNTVRIVEKNIVHCHGDLTSHSQHHQSLQCIEVRALQHLWRSSPFGYMRRDFEWTGKSCSNSCM